MQYLTLSAAAKGLGVTTMTLRRWRDRGELAWEPGQALIHDALVLLKDRLRQEWKAKVASKAKGRRKYFTPEERAHAACLAVKRFRAVNHQRATAIGRQDKQLKRHPCFADFRRELWEYYGPLCLACQQRPADCVDHVKPLSQGGANHPMNLQPLCKRCNTAKARQSTDYRPDRGYWIAIRWGGWKANGYGANSRSQARLKGYGAGFHSAVAQWRLPRAHAGALLAPTEYLAKYGYKSSYDKAPAMHSDDVSAAT